MAVVISRSPISRQRGAAVLAYEDAMFLPIIHRINEL